jgi:hypothetical protein
MSGSRSGLLDLVFRGVELLLKKESGSASFGTKAALSLNGADLSSMNSVTGSACRAKCSNILYDTMSLIHEGFDCFRLACGQNTSTTST